MSSDFQDQKPDFLVQTFAVSFAFDYFFRLLSYSGKIIEKIVIKSIALANSIIDLVRKN